MEQRFCPSCGTEVDADTRFCPTCGTTLTDLAGPDLPAAPAWPQSEPGAPAGPEPAAPEPAAGGKETLAEPGPPDDPPLASPAAGEATRAAAPQQPGAGSPPAPPAPPPADAPSGSRGADLPFTWPATLSGWLIGGGAAVGALSLIASLTNAVSLLLFLALLGIAATVFLAERLPDVPRLRLLTLAVTLVGLGVALDRAGFTARGTDSILLVAMIAAAGGALLIELDRDRPLPPPDRG